MRNNRKLTNEKKMSIGEYRKNTLKRLKRDFKITITEAELAHAETLTTEIRLDQFSLAMLNKYWR